MAQTQLPHYHIRWSGKATLDWETFDTSADAEVSAKKLMQSGETYTIEEHDTYERNDEIGYKRIEF